MPRRARKKHTMTHVPAPGARLFIRDQEWVVRDTKRLLSNDYLIDVTGLTPLVRDKPWKFIRKREDIIEVNPNDTKLVCDTSPNYLSARLHIESLLRATPPPENSKLYLGHRAAMDDLAYQREPALMALKRPRPRILIADGTGLGKTIEAGILIAELIRRGRGKRILVVSLASMLTQFQKELWSRFSIPLVRLDSIGINRVRDQLPAGHNPFHHFDRAIISIDTLKSATTWRPFLERASWDIVVIDEVQNVAKKKNQKVSLRHKLADILTARCDSLIMLSATPHDGQAESFASLIQMLDPTVIADPRNYTKADLEGKNLLVRRFKKDIRDQTILLERETELRSANALPEEERVFSIIANTRHEQLSLRTGDGWLLRTTMEKAVLSSPSACLESVQNRIKKLEKAGKDESDLEPWRAMEEALQHIGASDFSKYQLLLDILGEWNWTGKNARDRLVIFTERIATLEFLENNLAHDLGLSKKAIRILHGTLSDVDQQRIVDEFGQDQSPVRLLISTDVGSEGINLHYHCRRLIHFDIPWSLMRFQQRNGRIDRYGQKRKPQICYLITKSDNKTFRGDVRVLELLIEKEKQAEKNLGDPASLMGVYQIEEEENIVAEAFEKGLSKEEAEKHIIKVGGAGIDPLAELLESLPVRESEREITGDMPSLFASDYAYAIATMSYVQAVWAKRVGAPLSVESDDEKQRITIVPQNQEARTVLKSVINQLPVSVRPKNGRFVLSSDPQAMMTAIRKCRAQENTWPELQYLWSVHPLMEWMTDKVRLAFGRLEAPAIILSTMAPGTFAYLITVLWPNRKGTTIFQRWYLVEHRSEAGIVIKNFESSSVYESLQYDRLPNTGREPRLLKTAQRLVSKGVEHAREFAMNDRKSFKSELERTLNKYLAELKELEDRQKAHVEHRFQIEDKRPEHLLLGQRDKELKQVRSRFKEFRAWMQASMTMEEDPYVHVAAVMLSEDDHGV
ncbi:MAG: DEAD/DEAH box helicase [Bacteroidetes bacterium]|nr:DEAD/DEAH box helicase [Bacteroidota bacterium]